MHGYLTAVETAERWNITTRRVQILCNQNRVNGAIKESGVWFIPFSAKKPERLKAGKKAGTLNQLRVLSLFSGCGGIKNEKDKMDRLLLEKRPATARTEIRSFLYNI